jgi:hypothetical protein
MDPVFTLQWPEFVLAEALQRHFKRSDGFAIMIPLSREEKAIDLALMKKDPQGHRVLTFQVKASRSHLSEPPKREGTKRFIHGTWFNCFEVQEAADYYCLLGWYAPERDRTRPVSKTWYQHVTLVFTNAEMRKFLATCEKVRGGPDKMFGFGFDDSTQVFQSRGDPKRQSTEYSHHLLERRLPEIRDRIRLSLRNS